MKLSLKAKVQALVDVPQSKNMAQVQLQVLNEDGNPVTTFALPMNNPDADALWAARAKDVSITIEQ